MKKKVDREYLLRQERVPKALKMMIIPSIVAGVINQLNIVLDALFLGQFAQYPVEAQTATNNALPVMMFMMALSFMLAIGTAVTCSQFLGQGKKEKVEQYMANGFVSGWIIYVILLVVLIPMTPFLIEFLSKVERGDGPLYANSYSYMIIMIIGFPTIIFAQLSSQAIRAEGQAKLILKLSFAQVIINCIVNYVLISPTFSNITLYGSNYEAAGAAIGTVISQLFMSVILMTILFNKNKTSYFVNLKRFKFEKDWLVVFKNGFPQFLACMFFAGGLFMCQAGANYVYSGEEAEVLAASVGLINKVVMMMFMLMNGAVQGVQGFFAYQYGAKSYDRLLEGLKIIRKLAIGAGAVFFVVFIVGAESIGQVFSPSNQMVADQIAEAMTFFAFTMLVFPLAHSFFGLFAALGRRDLSVKSSIIRDFILFWGLAFLLPRLLKGTALHTESVTLIMPLSLLLGSIVIIIFGFKTIKSIEADIHKDKKATV